MTEFGENTFSTFPVITDVVNNVHAHTQRERERDARAVQERNASSHTTGLSLRQCIVVIVSITCV